ncbi:MAG TPA: PCRF domain-containing protein, partial [Dehalococcoidia bacterium]|nr:PCRF domain-containing protein [Dehalococcoidia bacterium]
MRTLAGWLIVCRSRRVWRTVSPRAWRCPRGRRDAIIEAAEDRCRTSGRKSKSCKSVPKTFSAGFDVPTLEREISRLESVSSQPEFWNDTQDAQRVMRRLADVRADVDAWRSLEARVRDLSDLLDMAEAEGDDSILSEIAADVAALTAELDERELSLALAGPYDRRDAILAIHAGAGGTDSQDWAEMLLRMYLRWAENRGYATEILDMTPGEEAGIKSATIEVRGPNAYGYLRAERGV